MKSYKIEKNCIDWNHTPYGVTYWRLLVFCNFYNNLYKLSSNLDDFNIPHGFDDFTNIGVHYKFSKTVIASSSGQLALDS